MQNSDEMSRLVEDLKGVIAGAADIDPATIQPETRFYEDLGIDSITAVEVAFAIDDKYHVTLSDEDAARLTCLRSAAELLWERLHSAASPRAS